MFTRILLLSLSLLFCVALPAQKTKERVKNRAENRANNRVDRKVDQAVDEAFDAIGNLFKKKNKKKKSDAQQPAGQPAPSADDRGADDGDRGTSEDYDGDEASANFMRALGMGGDDHEPYTNERSFSLTMLITEIKKNGKEKNSAIDIAVAPTQVATRIDDGNPDESVRTIFDTQSGKTTVVTTKKGTTEATRMRMPNFSNFLDEDDIAEAQDGMTFQETSETRTIDGYRCRKIIATDTKRGSVTEAWVTDDIDLTHRDVFGSMASMFGGGRNDLLDQMQAPISGFFVEGTTTEKSGKVIKQRLTDIRRGESAMDKSLFDLSGISVEDVGY